MQNVSRYSLFYFCHAIFFLHQVKALLVQPTIRQNEVIRIRRVAVNDVSTGVGPNNHGIHERGALGLSAMKSHIRQYEDRISNKKLPDKLLGTLVLLTVPLSWGTYVPVVRYLYAIQPPVPGFVFSACYYALAAVTTTTLAILQEKSFYQSNDELSESESDSATGISFPFFGGIELGSYLFVANCLQVIGLQTVESDRAGFLVQLTTVMVPLTEGLFAGKLSKIPLRTWTACMFALIGLFIMGLDGKDNVLIWDNLGEALLSVVSSFSQGDFLIIGAAVLYTLHVVRLSTYARKTTPMKLAASKATMETVLSLGLIFVLMTFSNVPVIQNDNLLSFASDKGREITTFFGSFSEGLSNGSLPQTALFQAIGAVLWTGWITCAYTIWAQSFGQARVRYVFPRC
jgi:hypothetical protein